ncbi:MAG TPA: DegT/DnrJ/EryC1/StrS family aminotransferase [Clostridiaceae bacterium]|nr:DegT/DnrJ/EryC1/StrS family aminotransferase [Clostridiaceae bacterium]
MTDVINVTRSSLPPMDEFIKEIAPLWESRWLTNMGDKHDALESALIDFLDADHLVLFCNGHHALEAAIQCFDFPAGSEIITSPFTFVSTTQAIVHSGLVPVFADIDPKSMTLDPAKVGPLINERTVAILPIHVYGFMADVQGFNDLKDKYNIKVIYDAAHAFGETFNGKNASQFGDISMFSFHATKVFNTIEGGALTFSDGNLRERIAAHRNFGMRRSGDIPYVGSNSKLNEVQAAMGLCNLRHIDDYISARQVAVERYNELLREADTLWVPTAQLDVKRNGAYYPVFFRRGGEERDRAFDYLRANNIMVRKYFHPLTSRLQFVTDRFAVQSTPIAARMSDTVLCLPLYEGLTETQQQYVVDTLRKGQFL